MTDARVDGAPPQTKVPQLDERGGERYWEMRARQYQDIHDGSPDGMMIFRSIRDAGGDIVDFEWLYCNSSASAVVGRRPEDLIGQRLLFEMPGNRDAGLFDIYVNVVDTGAPHSHEFPYRHERLDHWFRATSIKVGDGFYVTFSDVTARKRAEEDAARLAAIVRSSEHAIYSTSRAGIVETWNKGAETLFGCAADEMIGQSILSTIPVDFRSEHEDALRRVLDRGGVESFQTVRLTKAGAPVHVAIMLSPIHDLDGRTVGTAAVATDISEQVKMQERLVITDRLASVGTLAAGMAHQINNPLASVTANLEVALEELRSIGGGSLSGRLKDVETSTLEAQDGVARIGTIVRELMTFSRADEERRTVVDMNALLELSVKLAIGDSRDGLRIVTNFGSLPPVLADEARLGLVFMNVLANAVQALAGAPSRDDEIRIVTSTDGDGRAVIEMHDTGPGLAQTVIGRVFDPYFTTKPVGEGAGLGLSICRNIVMGMNGEITVRNNEGRGTAVRIVLPAASLTPPAPPIEALFETTGPDASRSRPHRR